MHKIRLGIIGVGLAFERLHYPALEKLQDKFEIVALCDPNQKQLAKWQQKLGLKAEDLFTDYQQMLKRQDIDAFDILVPIELNYVITETVATAGKPIICEKPLAPTKQQAEAARQLTDKYQIPILIAENYRYSEEFNIIRDLVREKAIGETKYFIFHRAVDFPEDMLKDSFAAKEWRQHPEFPGGVFLDSGVHDLAAMRHVFGAIQQVQAFGVPQTQDFSPYTIVQTNLKFHNGIIGQYTFCTAGQEMLRPLIGLRIFGTEGMIYLEETSCSFINVAYNNGETQLIPYQPDQGFYNELLNFYKASTGEEVLAVPPEMEFGDADTIFAILDSIKTNQVVSVDHTIEYQLV